MCCTTVWIYHVYEYSSIEPITGIESINGTQYWAFHQGGQVAQYSSPTARSRGWHSVFRFSVSCFTTNPVGRKWYHFFPKVQSTYYRPSAIEAKTTEKAPTRSQAIFNTQRPKTRVKCPAVDIVPQTQSLSSHWSTSTPPLRGITQVMRQHCCYCCFCRCSRCFPVWCC